MKLTIQNKTKMKRDRNKYEFVTRFKTTQAKTHPTSVNLVASTLMKGASTSFERRRAISVLPQPVGPTWHIHIW